MTHYECLRVARTASAREIRDAYRRAARETHPDRHGERAAARMAAVNEAYRVLSDPIARRRYDDEIAEPVARPAAHVVDAEPEPWRYVVDATPARFPWRFMAVMATLGMAVVVLGLILTKPQDDPPPDNVLRPSDCVELGADLFAREVLCTGPHDAVVQTLVPFGDTCPTGTESYQDRQGMGMACVVRTPP